MLALTPGLADEDMRGCLAMCHDDRLMISASTEPDGAGNLVVRLFATGEVLYRVLPEDMEGAASMAVGAVAFGDLLVSLVRV